MQLRETLPQGRTGGGGEQSGCQEGRSVHRPQGQSPVPPAEKKSDLSKNLGLFYFPFFFHFKIQISEHLVPLLAKFPKQITKYKKPFII